MTKNELIRDVADSTGATQASVKETLDAALECIVEELEEDGEVSIAGFGKFSVAHRAARTGRNPATKETIQIAASTSPKFKAAKAFKDRV